VWNWRDSDATNATFLCKNNAKHQALRLLGDAYIDLSSIELGGSIAMSMWVKMRTISGDVALFNSFQSESCGDSDACRNAVGDILDRNGWFAIGNRNSGDLWVTGTIFAHTTAAGFWLESIGNWVMITVAVAGVEAAVYTDGTLAGVGTRSVALPRMLRRNNYIGSGLSSPFRHKSASNSIDIAQFRLYDRGLAAVEVVALFADPSGEHTACCVVAGVKDAFGVGDVDLTPQAMGVAATGRPAAIDFSTQAQGNGTNSAAIAEACGSRQAQTTREVDICGDFTFVADCDGVVSDGIGPYSKSADCAIHLSSPPGVRYTLTLEEFETEADVDFLAVYDGASEDAVLLGRFTGTAPPAPLTSSGTDLYLHFTSNDNIQAVGFRAAFVCVGTPLEYWKPSTVASKLVIGVPSEHMSLRARQTACLSDVLLSVQCCADAQLSCANARVTEVDLSKHQLRGSLPEQLVLAGGATVA
jgi:hypothetical protein